VKVVSLSSCWYVPSFYLFFDVVRDMCSKVSLLLLWSSSTQIFISSINLFPFLKLFLFILCPFTIWFHALVRSPPPLFLPPLLVVRLIYRLFLVFLAASLFFFISFTQRCPPLQPSNTECHFVSPPKSSPGPRTSWPPLFSSPISHFGFLFHLPLLRLSHVFPKLAG